MSLSVVVGRGYKALIRIINVNRAAFMEPASEPEVNNFQVRHEAIVEVLIK